MNTEEERREILQRMLQASTEGDIDEYAKAYDELIDFEKATGEYDVQACRVCQCTEDDACPGGCSWVETDLCSTCAAFLAAIRVVR